MDTINRFEVGNMEVGDVLSLDRNNNPKAYIIKAEKDKCIGYELSEDNTILKLTTINTILDIEDIFTKMTQEQLEDNIKLQKKLLNQMKLANNK